MLATSYAMYFAGRFMYDFYLKTTAEIEGGNLDSMPQVSIFRLTVQFWNFEQNELNWQEAVTKLTLFQYF